MKHVNLGKVFIWAATAALVVVSAESGKAQLIGLDLGIQGDTAYSGTGVLGESFTEVGAPSGATWQEGYLGTFNPYGSQNPAVSLPGGITLTTGFPNGAQPNQGGYASENGSVAAGNPAGNGLVYQSIWNLEGANATNGTMNGLLQFTFSGLAANTVFTIAGYGDGGTVNFTTDLGNFSLAGTGGSSSFLVNQNYTVFTGLTDSSGNLVIDYTGDASNGGNAGISALSIEGPAGSVAVPEPSTWALMAAGIGSLVFFARRRAAAQSLR